jgi:hypothetical protein
MKTEYYLADKILEIVQQAIGLKIDFQDITKEKINDLLKSECEELFR